MAFDEGIHLICSVMVGSPDGTEDDLPHTFGFLSDNQHELCEIEVNPLASHPGTPIWDYAKKKAW